MIKHMDVFFEDNIDSFTATFTYKSLHPPFISYQQSLLFYKNVTPATLNAYDYWEAVVSGRPVGRTGLDNVIAVENDMVVLMNLEKCMVVHVPLSECIGAFKLLVSRLQDIVYTYISSRDASKYSMVKQWPTNITTYSDIESQSRRYIREDVCSYIVHCLEIRLGIKYWKMSFAGPYKNAYYARYKPIKLLVYPSIVQSVNDALYNDSALIASIYKDVLTPMDIIEVIGNEDMNERSSETSPVSECIIQMQ